MERDASRACYYKSGLNLLVSDIKRLSAEWKMQNSEINPFYHFDRKIDNHSPQCNPTDNVCSFMSHNMIYTNAVPDNVFNEMSLKNPLKFIEKIANFSSKASLRNLSKDKMLQIVNSLEDANILRNKAMAKLCRRLLRNGHNLSKGLFNKIYQKIKDNAGCTTDPNSIFVSNSEVPNDLPFTEILVAKMNQGMVNSRQVLPVKCLIDCGSNVILIPYRVFKTWGFMKSQLQRSVHKNIQGSTGCSEIILGQIKLPFFLRTDQGYGLTEEFECLVTVPDYDVDFIILGTKALQSSSLSLKFDNNKMLAECQLYDKNKELKKFNLFLFNQQENDISCVSIGKGDTNCTLRFKQCFFSKYTLDAFKDLSLPLIDLDHFNTVFFDEANWPIVNLPEDFSISVPLLEPAKENFANLSLPSQMVYFTNERLTSKVCSPSVNSCIDPNGVHRESEHTEASCNAGKKVVGVVPAYETRQQNHQDNLSTPSLPENDIRNDFSEPLIKRISFDTNQKQILGRSEIQEKIDGCGRHLKGSTRDLLSNVLDKYQNIYSTSKFQIGDFSGFRASINVKEDATAVQKERRISAHYSEGVRTTMEQLTQNGVFALSEEGQNTYCCNLNVVPKPANKTEVRSSSKADKHIMRMKAKENQTEKPTSFRATFDLKSLNAISVNNGRLQLPTVDETRIFVRDKLCSVLDLSNQFWSIRLDDESRKYTNFYYNGKIYWHCRMPMGFVNAPYIASKAMQYTFSDGVFEKFLRIRGLTSTDVPYKSYSEFLIIYLDDIVCGTHTSGKDSSFDKFKLHSICLDAILFALEQSGWIIGLEKCEFMTQDFVFLGQRFNTVENSTGLESSRIQAILEWRSPRSIPETESRLSVLSYFSSKIPGLRLIALPLIAVIRSGVFKWGLFEEQAFQNLKFLIALQIKNFNFNPDYKLVLTNDASKVAISSCLFQLNPTSSQLELLDTQTKLLSAAERSYSPVQREGMALFYGLAKAETFIRNSNAETLVLSDASSIQWIMRTKQHNSRAYEQMLMLSSLPNINLFYTNGKSLLLVDVLTRQYQDVFLKNNAALSPIQASFIPPLGRHRIPNLTKLSNEKLVDFMLSEPETELIDVYDKKELYHQNVHESHVTSHELGVANEQQLFSALKLGFSCPETLNLPVFKDILKSQKSLSKSAQDYIIRNHNLKKLKNKIEQLDIDPKLFTQYLQKYRSPELMGMLSNSRGKYSTSTEAKSSINNASLATENSEKSPPPIEYKSSFLVSNVEDDLNKCNCDHCSDLVNKIELDYDLCNILNKNTLLSDFVSSSLRLLPGLNIQSVNNLLHSRKTTSCAKARVKYDLILFVHICKSLESFEVNTISHTAGSGQPEKLATVIPVAIKESPIVSCHLMETSIVVTLNRDITLAPMELFYIDIYLKLFCSTSYSLKDAPDTIFMAKLGQFDNFLSVSGGNLLNSSCTTLVLNKGQEIFRISFEDKDSRPIIITIDFDVMNKKEGMNEEIRISQSIDTISSMCAFLADSYVLKTAKKTTKELAQHVENLCHAAGIPKQAHKPVTRNASRCFLARQTKLLSTLLLGQNLAKNFGVLAPDVLRKDQQIDYGDIFDELKDERSKAHEQFTLRDKILFKKSDVYGQCSLQLALSKGLAKEVITRLHNVNNYHISSGKLIALFRQSFYCPDIKRIVKACQTNCLTCCFFKRMHKSKVSGKVRSFPEARPGEHLFTDVSYMNESKAGNKFLMLIVDAASGYVCAYPMKKLNDTTTSDQLKSYLAHFPAPAYITSDGGPEYDKKFLECATQQGILVRTSVPRRSQPQGQVEKAIRDFRNLLVKIIANQGRDSWDTFVTMCCQVYNTVVPYNSKMSRASLMLGPVFFNRFYALLSHNVDRDLFNQQRGALKHLSDTRTKNLKKLSDKIGPVKSELLKGCLCTEEMNASDQITIGGSRKLLPTSKNIFRILRILPNSLVAEVKNVNTGLVTKKSIENLRRIEIEDIADVALTLNPDKLFEDVPSARRNVLQMFKDKDESSEVTAISDNPEEERFLRSGASYNTYQRKSILKASKVIDNRIKLEHINAVMLKSFKKALLLQKALYGLSPDETELLLFKAGNSLKQYNAKNTFRIAQSERKVSFLDSKPHVQTTHFSAMMCLLNREEGLCMSIQA